MHKPFTKINLFKKVKQPKFHVKKYADRILKQDLKKMKGISSQTKELINKQKNAFIQI